MSIEEQIRTIANEELEKQLSEMEKRFQEVIDKEIGDVKVQLEEISENLGGLSSRIERRFRGALDKEITEVKGQVEEAMMKERSQAAYDAFVGSLRTKAEVEISLPDVRPPAYDLKAAEHSATFTLD